MAILKGSVLKETRTKHPPFGMCVEISPLRLGMQQVHTRASNPGGLWYEVYVIATPEGRRGPERGVPVGPKTEKTPTNATNNVKTT